MLQRVYDTKNMRIQMLKVRDVFVIVIIFVVFIAAFRLRSLAR